MNDIIDIIRAEYLKRQSVNARYSMRSFSRQTCISPGSLSEIMSRKRPVTHAMAKKIAFALFEDTQRRIEFLETYQGYLRSSGSPVEAAPRAEEEINLDTLELMTDWRHFAVLSLLETKGAKAGEAWIAKRLSLPVPQVQLILERLGRLSYLRRANDSWALAVGSTRTPTDVPSTALRKLHAEVLAHAISSLDSVAVDERDVTSMTLAIDSSRIPMAKELIRSFRRTLAEFLEGGERDEVFHFNIQLVPVTKPSKETNT